MADKLPSNRPLPLTRELRGQAQLQELYNHLDNIHMGDKYLAWYGQCRAKEMTHEAAMRDTIKHFSIASQSWYQATLGYAEEKGRPMRDFT